MSSCTRRCLACWLIDQVARFARRQPEPEPTPAPVELSTSDWLRTQSTARLCELIDEVRTGVMKPGASREQVIDELLEALYERRKVTSDG